MATMVDRVQRDRPHVVDGKTVDTKRATLKGVSFFIYFFNAVQSFEPNLLWKCYYQIALDAYALSFFICNGILQEESTAACIRKIFVGGIKDSTTESTLRSYFSNFGVVEIVECPVDQKTKKKRGFAYVTFNDADPVDKVSCEYLSRAFI